MAITIMMPASFKVSSALKFLSYIEKLEEEEEYIFDFRSVGHTSPFGLLMVSDAISSFRRRQLFFSSKCANHERLGYQAHMGFFKACEFEKGAPQAEASGSGNYVPITHLSVDEILDEADREFIPVGVVVEKYANKLSEVLTRSTHGNLYDVLSYSIREIMRNVVEHSSSKQIKFCAQYWPTKNRVHVAILDNGRGIKESLSENPNLDMATDLEALKMSLMPGISGRMFKGVRKEKYNPWQNSGYGLYMTSRLATSGGSFFIVSGNAGYGITSQSAVEIPISGFAGTAINISIDTSRLGELSSRLHEFDREGREIAKLLDAADSRGASIASLMIKTKFQREIN